MLIRYVRKNGEPGKRGEPTGCVIALDEKHIGWSACCHLDRFNKERAKQIAIGRAIKGTKAQIPDKVKPTLAFVSEKAIEYFKKHPLKETLR